ncbi:MAG: chemotaxis response regulator protein-glutamate methylesterase [Pirellulaceae bacterium]|jgi:two-component system chemotaxis response regulator CheB|nr:chemotaxis response regulator protein-glutamate methylesterase [Pirellulaceae bacterium]
MNQKPLRALVVDDSAIYRKVVRGVLESIPNVEVVGVAQNGKIALTKLARIPDIDLITLDIEMPELDGLGLLGELRAQQSPVKAIMLSSLTSRGAEATTKALALGAFDFALKPAAGQIEQNIADLREQLAICIQAIGESLHHADRPAALPAAVAEKRESGESPVDVDVVGIGISTGGPAALMKMLPQLPQDLGAGVLIVQHMPPQFTRTLADDLNQRCKCEVREAVDGDRVEPGVVLIAPGGQQMRVARRGAHRVVEITDDPPINCCKPAADYLFRSLAQSYGRRALGIIMTGMGSDGAEGLRLMKAAGSRIVAQDEESCVVFGMPSKPVAEGIVDFVCPLDHIANRIARYSGNGAVPCR